MRREKNCSEASRPGDTRPVPVGNSERGAADARASRRTCFRANTSFISMILPRKEATGRIDKRQCSRLSSVLHSPKSVRMVMFDDSESGIRKNVISSLPFLCRCIFQVLSLYFYRINLKDTFAFMGRQKLFLRRFSLQPEGSSMLLSPSESFREGVFTTSLQLQTIIKYFPSHVSHTCHVTAASVSRSCRPEINILAKLAKNVPLIHLVRDVILFWLHRRYR